ncbi:hypothetical protein [Bacillus sp. PS06]|uniref:hypothetical protein n=1 Tax=Bacillus sp. PS06 TaxID=2764176 RepID=UPI0017807F81|nr:hypothetical protein [Bacillus sp. PS06]MBD8069907.1 hypothetical protein [Bacillus sp. PS06]
MISVFISEYGNVFSVFDKQDSGYLCFGVQNNNKKLFIKMAGAETIRSNVGTDVAITRLKSTVLIYEDLRHPILIEMIDHKEIEKGLSYLF